MVFNATWGNSTSPPNGTFPAWVIPPNPGRSLQVDIVVCAVLTFLIASTFVALRFYTRGYVNRVLSASDWCILPALLCAAGVTASSIEQMAHGAGKHFWEVDPFKLLNFERAAWYGILFYNVSLTLSRISILLLYKRIFTYNWIKRTIQIVLVLVIAIGIWFIVSVCTACLPLEAFWNWSLYFTTHVYCQPVNLWWGNAALHIVSDLVIMALPMPVLSSLNLPRRQKYAIVGVFALGFFVCVISIVRLVALVDVTEQQAYDATYTSANMIFWTSVEVNAAITCACIMTFKPLIQRVFPRLLSPSKGLREPALQWITPAHTNNDDSVCTDTDNPNRNNSFPTSPTSPTTTSPVSPVPPTAARRGSAASFHHHHHHHTKNRSGSGSDEYLEKSRYYHSFSISGHSPLAEGYDLDRDLDLEAQRTCSDFSVVTGDNMGRGGEGGGGASSVEDGGGDDDTPLDPRAMLRAPPRAHLRMGAAGQMGVPVLRDVDWGDKEAGNEKDNGKEHDREKGKGESSPGCGEEKAARRSPACGRCGFLEGEDFELREGVGRVPERSDGESQASVSSAGRDRA